VATYLERYFAGEREAVWAELSALGVAIQEEPLASDTLAVARETMRRVRVNVELLAQRLTALGYRFISDVMPRPHVPPTDASLAKLRTLQEQYGPLPLSLRTWYEVVGAVDFMGVYPQLSAYETPDPRDIASYLRQRGLNVRLAQPPSGADAGAEVDGDLVSDPLVIWPCDDPLVDELVEADDAPDAEETARYSLCLAPDALHKANVSGGDGPHIDFGQAGMDAPLRGDDWAGVPFITYLRTVFAWGGFPGLRHAARPPRDLLAGLCADLLPI
jgi:hypothetical protein